MHKSSRGGPVMVAKLAQEAFIPERKYLDGEPDHVWRNGKPDYTAVNQAYLAGKTRDWAADSLESLVESVVKTLEMEISHKVIFSLSCFKRCRCAGCWVVQERGWACGYGGNGAGSWYCLAQETASH